MHCQGSLILSHLATGPPEVHLPPEPREEDTVEVDKEKVLEILCVLRGEWVHGPVISCGGKGGGGGGGGGGEREGEMEEEEEGERRRRRKRKRKGRGSGREGEEEGEGEGNSHTVIDAETDD